MHKNVYQLWARYENWFGKEQIISDLDIYSSEEEANKNLDMFLNRVKNNYRAKEILETGFDILFFHEGE